MLRLFKYASVAAVIGGALWFFAGCQALSSDNCAGEPMKPGDVCMSSRGGSLTYEEALDAKKRGPQAMKSAGALLALGVVGYLTVAVITLRREPDEV